MKTTKKKQSKKGVEDQTKKEKESADIMDENNPRVNSQRKKAFKNKQKEKKKRGEYS